MASTALARLWPPELFPSMWLQLQHIGASALAGEADRRQQSSRSVARSAPRMRYRPRHTLPLVSTTQFLRSCEHTAFAARLLAILFEYTYTHSRRSRHGLGIRLAHIYSVSTTMLLPRHAARARAKRPGASRAKRNALTPRQPASPQALCGPL